MLEVILLQLAVVEWETIAKSASNSMSQSKGGYVLLVMQKVVRQVVADVSEDAAAVSCSCGVPVVVYYCVRKFPEGYGENHEECWRHDEPKSVHRQIMVNAVEKEVQCNEKSVIGKVVVDVEQTSVHSIFDKRPNAETEDPVAHQL